MQSERNTREGQQQQEVPKVQSSRLEDRLHEGNIDQTQLYDERDRNRRDEHPVSSDRATETAILNRRNEVEEDEACECLMQEDSDLSQKHRMPTGGSNTHHSLFPARHPVI